MKALILNSGVGSRLGALTTQHPKCMTGLSGGETILSRQLRQLAKFDIRDVVITTGPFPSMIEDYAASLGLPLNITFVNNPDYARTNYIYSIDLAAPELDDELLMMHGDLVFADDVLQAILHAPGSRMAVSTTQPLPEKDFKAVLHDGRITRIGVDCFENAVSAQPLYHLRHEDWRVWLSAIHDFCKRGETSVYAENALNTCLDRCCLTPLDVGDRLCGEIDTPEDLEAMTARLQALAAKPKTVYMSFSTDILHMGHINIIQKAAALGEVTIGVLSDEVVASYKRFPLVRFEERAKLLQNIRGVSRVVPQTTLSYEENLHAIRPDYVVHGDDWRTGPQRSIRESVLTVLREQGGELVEFPYSNTEEHVLLERSARSQLAIPDMRRGRLRSLLKLKPVVTIIEAHSGLTGLIAENTVVTENERTYQFDGMWVSSLCDSTAKGKPDIELVDMSSRLRTIDDIMEVTTKPIILDGDTGGIVEHFVHNIRTLERMGVSAVIIEDKIGLKKNSLFGTEVEQTQDTIEHFCEKIQAGKRALKTRDFMLIARIESLILEKGMDDALARAFAYVKAGADGIMIHSRKQSPDEIFTFCERFRAQDALTPLVVVPTSFNQVTEDEFARRQINIVIYANQLTRSAVPAMMKTAETILRHHRALEADQTLMPFKDIIRLIPEE